MGLAVEALFGVIFARVLLGYLRGRDVLHRDVVAMFSAMGALFVIAVAQQVLGQPPRFVADLGSILLLGQPFLTVRVVRRVRALPALLYRATLAGWLASAVLLVMSAGTLPPPALVLIVISFVASEAIAAGLFAAQARRQTGAARARLLMAAAGTALFAMAIMAAGAGAGGSSAAAIAQQVAQFLALLSALAYLGAFAPPAWLRRVWSSRSAY